MLGFHCSTYKIIRIMFIVTVFVIHCGLRSSTNHNSARYHLPTGHCPRPPRLSVQYTASHNRNCYFFLCCDGVCLDGSRQRGEEMTKLKARAHLEGLCRATRGATASLCVAMPCETLPADTTMHCTARRATSRL